MKSGFVSIIGKSNVGKSTLLNHILHSKISIVSDKQQTTRNAIKGIYEDEQCQIVFIDTPGIHQAKQKLGEEMNHMAYGSINDSELILLVVDASKGVDEQLENIISRILKKKLPIITVINKIDLISIDKALALKDKLSSLINKTTFVEMVARDGFNIDTLINEIKALLPEGPRYYEIGTKSDVDVVFQIKEIIREKALYILRDEVPHSIAVYIQDIKWEENPLPIFAQIIVEKESQKGIVIGKNGQRLKSIGLKARQSIEALLHKHVYLSLTVKVNEDWRNTDYFLENFGYKNKK